MPIAHQRLLPQLLRWLPKRLLAELDAWSFWLARRHAEQRRSRTKPR